MTDGRQEINVSEAFSRQSTVFDAIDDANSIIGWMRERVRKEVLHYIKPSSSILELNCGTGIDSIFFAKRGHHVTATDNAGGMLAALDAKVDTLQLQQYITTKKCSFNNLEQIEGQFDYVFSNFGGLNCTDKLDKVLDDITRLLKPGGYFTLVIMPKVCPWEILTLFKGYFKTAFRRFGSKGTSAHLEGVHFQCYYYAPSFITRHLRGKFTLSSLKGLSIVVPPPYIEGFMEKRPELFRRLEKIENSIWAMRPFNGWADHYMITMQKL